MSKAHDCNALITSIALCAVLDPGDLPKFSTTRAQVLSSLSPGRVAYAQKGLIPDI